MSPLNAPECGYLIPQPVFWGDLCFTSCLQELDFESKPLIPPTDAVFFGRLSTSLVLK